jgi:predicted metallopeptidase
MAKEDFLEIGDDIIEFIKGIEKEFNIPIDITFKYVVNRKQKQLIKFTKIPDMYANTSSLNADIMVVVNDEYFDNFDNDTKKILIEKEFDRIDFNFEKGTIRVSNPKINVNNGFVEKHSWDKISNAIKLEEEFEQQRKDKEKDKN